VRSKIFLFLFTPYYLLLTLIYILEIGIYLEFGIWCLLNIYMLAVGGNKQKGGYEVFTASIKDCFKYTYNKDKSQSPLKMIFKG